MTEGRRGEDSLHSGQLRLYGTLATLTVQVKEPRDTVLGDRAEAKCQTFLLPCPAPFLSCIWSTTSRTHKATIDNQKRSHEGPGLINPGQVNNTHSKLLKAKENIQPVHLHESQR